MSTTCGRFFISCRAPYGAPFRAAQYWAALLCCAVGCGGGGLSTYPAGGTLKSQQGASFQGCTIVFRSVGGPKSFTARGDVGADGTFRMSTLESGDGAVEGEHKVYLIGPGIPAGADRDETPLPRLPFHEKYLDSATSGLQVTVTRDAAKNQFEIPLDP